MMKSSGYSLIELTVSLLLSSLIIAILMRSMLWIQQQTASTLQEIQRVEEEAWIVSFLRSRFYQAGFTPCRRLDELICVDRREETEALQSVTMEKLDALILRHMSHTFSTIDDIQEDKTVLIGEININANYPLIISDCKHAEIHEIKSVQKNKGRTQIVLKKPLFYDYEMPVYMGEWVSESFLIQHHALFYQHHHVDELVPWIHQMSGLLTQENGHTVLTLDLGEKHRRIKIHGRNV